MVGCVAAVQFEVVGRWRRLAVSAPLRLGTAPDDLSAAGTGVRVIELMARQIGPDQAPVVGAWTLARAE